MLRKIAKQRWPIAIGLFITLTVTLMQIGNSQLLRRYVERLDLYLYDIRLEVLLPDEPVVHPDIYIADIDERSLAQLGRWPWSRVTMARLVDELAEAGVKVAAFDILCTEAEENSAQKLLDDLALREMLDPEIREQLTTLVDEVDNDKYLAGHLNKLKVVLGYVFHSRAQGKGKLGYPVTKIPEELSSRLTVPARPGYSAALKVLQRRAAESGFLNAETDPDGIIRRMPMVMRYKNGLYPSLSLVAAQQFLGVRRIAPDYLDIGERVTIQAIDLGERSLPTDRYGQMSIAFQGGTHTYPYISVAEIMSGRYRGGKLDGALVFIGSTVPGLFDVRATPLSAEYPGVETHAVVADSIISQKIPYKPAWEIGALVVLLISLGTVLSVLQPMLRPIWLGVTTLLAYLGVVGGNYYLWVSKLFDLTQVTPLLLVSSIFLWNLINTLIRENRERKAVTSMFGQYVPSEYVQTIMESPDSYDMEGDSRFMSVMFADIRGFTDMSEKLTAQELKMVLNRFFTPITKSIFDNRGTIDKYVGDMVMAFWSAPMPDEEHRLHAIQAAFAMQAAIVELKKEFAAEGLPEIDMGIGINSGEMNVGDMGSTYRRAYTVLGDAVNLGSRVESLTKFYGASLLVTAATQEGASEYVYRFADRIRVKGKLEPVTIYEPLCPVTEASAKLYDALDKFHSGLEHFRQQDWSTAREIFQGCLEEPEWQNTHLIQLYLDRIDTMEVQGPGPEWDGVYTHTSK